MTGETAPNGRPRNPSGGRFSRITASEVTLLAVQVIYEGPGDVVKVAVSFDGGWLPRGEWGLFPL